MWKRVTLQVVSILLAVAATVISYQLLAKHLTGSGAGWFEAGCPVDAKPGGMSCAAVLQSPYGYWPPKDPAGTAKAGVRHWPVAFLGMAYYSCLVIWLVGVGPPTRYRRALHLIPLLLVALGLAGSCYFLYIMFSKLNEWCPWCLVTHVLNLLIAVCLVLMWPWKGKAPVPNVQPSMSPSELNEAVPLRFLPTWRSVVTAVFMMLVVVYLLRNLVVSSDALIAQQRTMMEAKLAKEFLTRVKSDPNRMLGLWNAGAQLEIPLRPDDPIRSHVAPDQKPLMDLIVFSDMECPSCKITAQFIEEQLQQFFAGRLRVIFKHYPLDQTCNAEIGGTAHKNACLAARIAEAARLQTGPEGFWKVHDLLFARQIPGVGLPGLDPREVAAALGLNAERLVTDLNSAVVTQRITEDTKEGKKCGIWATPLLIVHGKPVDGLLSKEITFWDALADLYWQSIGVPRPEQSRLKKSAADTPSTPAKATP